MRFRDGAPEDLARARDAVPAWRQQNPHGTGGQLAAGLAGQFRPGCGPVLRAMPFRAGLRAVTAGAGR